MNRSCQLIRTDISDRRCHVRPGIRSDNGRDSYRNGLGRIETMTFRFRPWVWYSYAINHRQTRGKIRYKCLRIGAVTYSPNGRSGRRSYEIFRVLVFGAVAILALCLRKKVRRDVEVIIRSQSRLTSTQTGFLPPTA